MIKSMTGYGRNIINNKLYGPFIVEIHTINSKYRDIIINLPKQLLGLESKIRELVSHNIKRGRINVFVSQPKGSNVSSLTIDTKLAKQYINSLKKIKKER